MTSRSMQGHDAPRRQVGLTLVEIMVALVVSLILIAGVIQIFVGTQQTYRFQDALARVQENGRFASEIMTRDARLAGYIGCTTLVSVTPNTIPPLVIEYSRDNYIEGLAGVAAGNPFNAEPGTDVMTLRMLSPDTARVSANMAVGGPVTIAVNTQGFAVNDVVAVADCNNVDIFNVTGVAGGGPVTITPANNLPKAYLEGAILSRFREVSYFVRPGAGGELALWRRELGAVPADIELIEGVEDLWILYGEDLNNDGAANAYVAADAVADWSRVRSMRISLLLASNEDNVTGGAQPINFRGAPLVPGDNRYRQVLTTTIGLRNRLP